MSMAHERPEHLTDAGPGKALSADEQKFANLFFQRAAPEDLSLLSDMALDGIVRFFFAEGKTRRPGTSYLRVFTPAVSQEGWAAGISIIAAINDDKPFLVDSVVGALKELPVRIHALFHPIMKVVRDPSGNFKSYVLESHADRAQGQSPANAESMICVAVQKIGSQDLQKDIERSVTEALEDVNLAVTDWKAMLMRLSQSIAELRMRPPRAAAEEVQESLAFLEWIEQNHFTFLGSRDYAFDGEEGGRLRPVPDSGLGLLRDPERRIIRRGQDRATLTPEVRGFLMQPSPLIITKANVRSTVHRRVHQDYIGVKRFDQSGALVGERRFVGLFTSAAYNAPPEDIPFLRRKVASVVARSSFTKGSHNAKALAQVLETYPRDELFQITEDDLVSIAEGIVYLQDRPRTKTFLRFDTFDRFVSALVFVPEDKFRARLTRQIGAILARTFDGEVASASVQNDEGQLTRLHIVVDRKQGHRPAFNETELNAELERAVRTWADEFAMALDAGAGEEAAALARLYGDAFSEGYRETYDAAEAVQDVRALEALRRNAHGEGEIGLRTWRANADSARDIRLKIYRLGSVIELSDILPILENFGLRVREEASHQVSLSSDLKKSAFSIHQFRLSTLEGITFDEAREGPLFEEALRAVWHGHAENDGFNRLTLSSGLAWRDVVVMRAIAKYLRQVALPVTQGRVEQALTDHPAIVSMLTALFRTRFEPAAFPVMPARTLEQESLGQAIEEALVNVPSLDDDRILRRYRNVILSVLRTNFYQRDEVGLYHPVISFKLDSHTLEELPLPRPLVEIFVYAPEVEGVHLRFGKVARGGIRWSDRRDDFRTEVLGLVKAQQVKNTVIVPVGSKGGFFPKKAPPPSAPREAVQAAGIAAYKAFIGALLDVTDNIDASGAITPPLDVVRWDGDDPYLVVAADKGTATFSDIANAISVSRKFWLSDAFASGGSVGYDHKKMGITARGAWEAVKRHFRELGRDCQSEPFSVIGVGDMSGDVFGNGMLLSRQIRLLAAFDHRDIFIDPEPDIGRSFAERDRLFQLARSSWADYDKTKISKGGGVFSRNLKRIPLSAEMRELLGVDAAEMEPNSLIQALLRRPVDLLWFGGIGTFVKASHETHLGAGDRANDALRVDAAEIEARIVGEGANLGFTQGGRIEFARNGGRINTDAIDNSAGVDTSDHEVNLKILLNAAIGSGELEAQARDALLARLTDQVAALVLKDNYLQSLALTVGEATARDDADVHGRLMRALEKTGRLNRAVEALPADEQLRARAAKGEGLTRPELAVLMAYSKLELFDAIDASALPDDPFCKGALTGYFPEGLAAKLPRAVASHRLRREIIATVLTNDVVNRCGPTFLHRICEASGVDAPAAVRAYLMADGAFGLASLTDRINALDGKVDASVQTSMHLDVIRHLQRQTIWFLRHTACDAGIAATIAQYAKGVEALRGTFSTLVSRAEAMGIEARIADLTGKGVDPVLADDVGVLPAVGAVPDIIDLAHKRQRNVDFVAGAFFASGRILGIDRLRLAAEGLRPAEHWDRLAVRRIADDLFSHQRQLAALAMDGADGADRAAGVAAVETWARNQREQVKRLETLLAELERLGAFNVARLTLAAAQVRDIVS